MTEYIQIELEIVYSISQISRPDGEVHDNDKHMLKAIEMNNMNANEILLKNK